MKKWGENNGIEFWTMSPTMAEEALDSLRNGFFQQETFCIAAGIPNDKTSQEELENLAVEAAQDEISVVAVEKVSNKIVGACYNKYQVSF